VHHVQLRSLAHGYTSTHFLEGGGRVGGWHMNDSEAVGCSDGTQRSLHGGNRDGPCGVHYVEDFEIILPAYCTE
jgi:hypothetical protein